MATPEREKIYECEVRRRRVAAAGGYENFWKTKSVADAVVDEDKDFRCKDCHGEVKLHRRIKPGGPIPHVEHKLRQDSEYCAGGMYFRQATDGREPKLSDSPIE